MPKQVFKICFFVFFLLSLNQISYSETKGNQPIPDAPESDQAPTLSPEYYTEESSPEDVEEPEFFSPERYPISSPPPVTEETLDTHELDADDYNVSLNKSPAPVPSTEDDEVKAPEPAPSEEVILPEADDDDYNSPIKASVTAPSIATPLSDVDMEYSTQVAPSVMALEEEEEGSVSPAPSPSLILPSTAEDADTLTLVESDQNNDYNSTTENLESVPSDEDSSTLPDEEDNSTIETQEPATSPEEDTESKQVVPPPAAAAVDEDVDMPPMSSNPSVMPYTYAAEDETVDIVYEENEGAWGSWAAGQNNGVKVAGVMVGVCLVGLAGLVYNKKNKKKTQFQYQSLSKGI
ncbi:hypothetical protein ACOSQ2_029950 [Xanthoceras sorbifolium]